MMAGNVVGRLVIEMSAGVARLEKDMAAARSSVNSATKSIDSAIGVTKNLLGALGVGLSFKAIIDQTSRSEQEINRFNALLRITGDQAGLTRLQLESMGKALEDASHFDDEDILKGQSTFLKFGNIQRDVFTEGMKLAADYAAFTGTEFAAGAQAVGRALQSPTQGLKALQLELGKLTPQQKEHIEKLMEQNKLAEAQGVVLEFVRGKIGGVSKEMNQGFLARTSAMSKEMGNLMEAIGKSFVGDATKSLLGFASQTLKDMRAIVEDGDWIEKLLGVLAMTGGMRGLNLTKQAPVNDRPGSVVGKVRRLLPLTPDEQEPTAEFLEAQRKAREKAAAELKKYRDQETKAAEAALLTRFNDAEEFAAAITKMRADEGNKRIADEKAAQEMMDKGEIDAQIERVKRWKEEQEAILEAKNAVVETNDIARDLGLTFSSAFEDAIVGGKSFRDVLKGISQDIARIITRKTITEPIGGAISKFVNGLDFGGLFSKSSSGGGVSGIDPGAMPALATGTPFVPRDGPAFLHRGEAVIPAAQNAGGAGPVFNVDMRGASVDAVARLERLVASVNGSIERRAMNVVSQARMRGAF